MYSGSPAIGYGGPVLIDEMIKLDGFGNKTHVPTQQPEGSRFESTLKSVVAVSEEVKPADVILGMDLKCL